MGQATGCVVDTWSVVSCSISNEQFLLLQNGTPVAKMAESLSAFSSLYSHSFPIGSRLVVGGKYLIPQEQFSIRKESD